MAAGRIFGVATTLGILAAGVWISLHGRGTVPSEAQVALAPAVAPMLETSRPRFRPRSERAPGAHPGSTGARGAPDLP